ncbi:MAG: hypothetical protein IKW39_03360 [Alphaproteobacteria bacterium]|nr:hypothetical protein [Alphaproteobacteria bacterium]
MNKVNIANYVVFDLSNRFYGVEKSGFENEIIGIVADNWHKKHFIEISGKNIKQKYDNRIRQNLFM